MEHQLASQEWRPHVLAVPFPAQGHVMPLMKLCRKIADQGIKVTFVNAEHIHAKVLAAMSDEDKNQHCIELTSIPDGLQTEEDRKKGLIESLRRTIPRNLTRLIEKINCENSDEKISCVIADTTLIGWIHDVSQKMEAELVAFQPGAAADIALILQIPKLIQDGNLDTNGFVMKNDFINLSNEMPPWRRNELPWIVSSDLKDQKIVFECCQIAQQAVHQYTKWLLCNTFYELESSACNLIPNFCPVGPLFCSKISKSPASSGSILAEDTTCLSWLDKQKIGSVIYVSFGSLAILSQDQLNEIALALELSDRPFLWVVRSNLANKNGFLARVAERAKIVEWAPQEQVLSHSSIGCFVSHCGWNSTMEGLSMGVPFLCWPYFLDQFHNQNYICDMWKIGLRLNIDENGLRSSHEIKRKIEMLFADNSIKANALKLKDMARKSVSESGSSLQNFETFIDHLKK
ncbi:UDP-glycosyltransferase 83A1 [Abeliophyllum distichum]|uniref:UDP-glycosyltransferase 83A1 n=1 Tax=Abeliophyllum distichum TaxID=126358 RepID=A0ABD1PMR1_9LAMI